SRAAHATRAAPGLGSRNGPATVCRRGAVLHVSGTPRLRGTRRPMSVAVGNAKHLGAAARDGQPALALGDQVVELLAQPGDVRIHALDPPIDVVLGLVRGPVRGAGEDHLLLEGQDRKSTRLNSSHGSISYAVFCLKKKKTTKRQSG